MKNFSLLAFLIFISILLSYFYLHLYTIKFISQISFIKIKILVKKFFIFMFFISFLSLVLRTQINNNFFEIFYLISLCWIGIILILGFYCFFSNFIILTLKSLNKDLIIIITILVSLLSIIYSLYNGNTVPKVREVNIRHTNLNVKNEINIVFISDTHFDFRYKNKIAKKIFMTINQLNPNFIVIGGDFLDPGFILDENVLSIKDCKFKKIIVFGNHEYYFGLDKARQIFEKLSFTILNNSSLAVDNINFIGLGDIRTENLSKQEVLEIINKNYKKDYLNIVISHQPLYFKEISENFDVIMLSGHIHKGQIFPFHIFTKLAYRHFYGLYKNKNSYLYVSSGAGVWGPPMRFFAKAEIVKINII